MTHRPSLAVEAAIHDLVNLHLFPECTHLLGQYERCRYEDVSVLMQRTGNLHEHGENAITYAYRLCGEGFTLHLLAIWPNQDQPTALVRIVGLDPADEEALEAWLARAVTGRRPLPDAAGYLDLH